MHAVVIYVILDRRCRGRVRAVVPCCRCVVGARVVGDADTLSREELCVRVVGRRRDGLARSCTCAPALPPCEVGALCLSADDCEYEATHANCSAAKAFASPVHNLSAIVEGARATGRTPWNSSRGRRAAPQRGAVWSRLVSCIMS